MDGVFEAVIDRDADALWLADRLIVRVCVVVALCVAVIDVDPLIVVVAVCEAVSEGDAVIDAVAVLLIVLVGD